MSRQGDNTGWLGLAIRQRQWQAEQGQPQLREALSAERLTAESRLQAQASLAQAERTQGQLRSQPFTADALARHMAYNAKLQQALQEAIEHADQAASAADQLREQAQALLAERDTLKSRLETLQAKTRMEQLRRESRAHDEHWLLRGSSRGGSTPEGQE